MNIVVPIKQVPETSAVRMDERTGTMLRDGVEAIVNPLDLYAIELALRIRELVGGQVTAISMGPPQAMSALREAVAMGVDDARLISDRAYAGSDTWATSFILAEAIRRLPAAQLVICGERATDGDTGQVGPAIAAWLDLPLVGYVSGLEEVSEQRCRLRRLVETGHEIVELELPGVLTVVKEAADPRLPTLHGKRRARALAIPVLNQESLRLPPQSCGLEGSPTRVVRIFRPRVARSCELVACTGAEGAAGAAESLCRFLRQRRTHAGEHAR